ncbi:MAG: hypothetical protein KAR17_10440 [Cyclobacteriaceae bacterium]|nr:hypothetical protein [Cyclobacteriaceae bacterium]
MTKNKFSPKKYIIEKGRVCPIFQCLVADGYDDMGLTICLIIRKQPSGKYMFTNLMLDRHCLGVKSAFCNCNFDDKQIEEIKQRMQSAGEIEEVDPTYFHNLVYAVIDFAEENGFKPPKDFPLAEKILDPDLIDDGIDEIEVGEEGKPLFINGPYDNVDSIIATLNRNVGEGNYDIIIGDGELDDNGI